MLTVVRNGVAIASVVLVGGAGVYTCCVPPGPPDPPPQPDPGVDAAWPPPEPVIDAAGDAPVEVDAPPPACEFKTPRARGLARPPRIVGGSAAKEGAYPYAVSVSDGDFHFCGASVIADAWILSAAHCQIRAGDTARIGANDRRKARQVRIVESRIHRGFDGETLKWDVAVARLESSAGVPAVRLAVDLTAEDATVIGWGRLSEGGPVTNLLQEVGVPLIPRDVCNRAYGDVDATQVCADTDGRGSCSGDSGGALLQLAPEGYVQIGIVSFGVGCARPPPYVGVYTSVSHPEIRQWIEACAR